MSGDDSVASRNWHEPHLTGQLGMSDSQPLTVEVLFIEDVVRILRTSRSTIERRRRDGNFPIPELPSIDGRPRWSRQAVEKFLRSTNRGLRGRRKRFR
jgi:hypothetical protein